MTFLDIKIKNEYNMLEVIIMRRKISETLLEWKNNNRNRMPLLLYGARQVGKTHILLEFGKQYYKHVAYVNLENNQAVRSYFAENISPQRILQYLEASTGVPIIPGETLVILDEIQSSERALTSLKYFNEEIPEYHIAGAGSLLGVALNREQYSFPVGNVDSMTLYPFDFGEFLWANEKDFLYDEIIKCFDANTPLPDALHLEAMDLYKLYLIIGGMPKSILEYLETKSLLTIPNVQSKIINDYTADMAKYASNSDSVKIRAAYNSIPIQLAKDNKKFQYKLARKGGTASIFGSAIDWLEFSGVVLKCQKIEQGKMPIAVYSDLSSFKLYMGDVGLLSLKSGISQQAILSITEIDNVFIGALTENYVAQQFAGKGYGLYYWASEQTAEIDFVLQKDNDIIPVEVKSGTRTKTKSLNIFIQKYQPAYSIRISAKNFGFANNIKSVPLYAVFCI